MSCTLKMLALLLLDEDENENANNQGEREFWVRPWLVQRSMYSTSHSLFQELRRDGKSFQEFLRMDKSQFEYLVEKISAKLTKEDTVMRQCIKPHEMVCVALRYLPSGKSFRSLQFQFRIGRKTIPEIEILGPDHLNTSRSKAR